MFCGENRQDLFVSENSITPHNGPTYIKGK